jgi:hypothetical protein
MTDELDRFRAAWGARPLTRSFEPAQEEAMQEILRSVKELDRRRLRRDVREIVIAAVAGGGGIFAAFLVWRLEPWAGVAVFFGGALAVAVAVWLAVAFLRHRDRASGQNLAEFCRDERRSLETQIRLMRSLPWWYLAPTLVGTNLFVAAKSESPAAPLSFVIPITVLVLGAVYWLSRRSLRRDMLPLRAELDRCLAGLEEQGGS